MSSEVNPQKIKGLYLIVLQAESLKLKPESRICQRKINSL